MTRGGLPLPLLRGVRTAALLSLTGEVLQQRVLHVTLPVGRSLGPPRSLGTWVVAGAINITWRGPPLRSRRRCCQSRALTELVAPRVRPSSGTAPCALPSPPSP
eukprot:scaffold92593_cov51-Phaeocystis_antarctica.AAC.5